MAWLYEIESGRMSRGGKLLAKGYAGAPGYVNDPTKTSIKNCGPLPIGFYTIGPPYDNPKTGPYTMDLIPDAANQMFDREDFRIHGDNHEMNQSASEGCPVQPLFARKQIGMGLATDNTLQVIAALPGPPPEEWNVT